MSDIDSDDDGDLWADMDDAEETTCTNVSANLLEAVTHAPLPVHHGDVDEGKVTWESPEAPGLQNSVKVNEGKNKHWYNEQEPAAAMVPPAAAAVPAPEATLSSAYAMGAVMPSVPAYATGAVMPSVPSVPPVPAASATMTAAPASFAFPAAEPTKAATPPMAPPASFSFSAVPAPAADAPMAPPPGGLLFGGGIFGGGGGGGIDFANLPKPGSLFG